LSCLVFAAFWHHPPQTAIDHRLPTRNKAPPAMSADIGSAINDFAAQEATA
jgi:hypothetical protein